jgi:predicted membrane channel-forming protein YqfA (hemolysin III family)
MRKPDLAGLKYVVMGFTCLVIALAVLRALGRNDMAPLVAGAVLLSVLVAAAYQRHRPQTPGV